MNTDVDAFLEHHGVKGQKWGVRNSKKVTGVSRSSGALLDRNELVRRRINAARSGKKYKISVAIGKKLVGEQKQKENWNRQLKHLSKQDKRLKAGKVSALDRLDKVGSLGVADLYLTPFKGKVYNKAAATKSVSSTAKKSTSSSTSSRASKPVTQKQANKQVGAFLKAHPTGRA